MMARLLTLPAGRTAQVGRPRRRRPDLRRARQPGGQVRGRAEERVVVVAPRATRSRVKALEAVKQFPGGELAPAVIVFERARRAHRRRQGSASTRRSHEAQRGPPAARAGGAGAGLLPERRVRARSSSRCSPATASGDAFQNGGAVDPRPRSASPPTASRSSSPARRATASTRSRSSAASTARCCYAAAAIVLVLLIIIYRSPIFWAIPFFSVAAGRGRLARRGLPAGRGGRDDQRPDRRHPARARLRRRAPTTRCCSSRATARSCAATRTSTRRWRSRCAAPGRRSSPPG